MSVSARTDSWNGPFLGVAALVAAFIAGSGATMPAVVASHFDAAGGANGTMPRAVYVALMLIIGVGLPVLIAFRTSAAVGRPGARINLPNREYWLGPERREATIARLRTGIRQFSAMLMVFLGYAHGLVVHANRQTPPRLPAVAMIAGLVGLGVATILWWRGFARGFRRSD